MSLAYLRSDALAELANCGQDEFEKVEKTTRELLGEKPGLWMPDDIVTSLELVERAYNKATAEGKYAIVLTLHRIIDDLGKAWLKRSLTQFESRQLLGAMELGVIWREESKPLACRIARLLWEAENTISLFSIRVVQITELTGDNRHALGKFVRYLWKKLPKHLQQQKPRQPRRRPQTNHKKLLDKWVSIYQKKNQSPANSFVLSDLKYFTSRIEGNPGIIKIHVKDKLHLVGVCPIIGGEDAFEVAENPTALKNFFRMLGQDANALQPLTLNAGNLEMQDKTQLNLIEGAYSRARGRFFDLMAELAACQISHPSSIDNIASMLWHKGRGSNIANVPRSRSDVLSIDSQLINQVAEVTESFEHVLASAEIDGGVQSKEHLTRV